MTFGDSRVLSALAAKQDARVSRFVKGGRRYKRLPVKAKVANLSRQVRNMRPEVKYFDQDFNFLLATNTPGVNLQKMFNIPQGVTVFQRLGSRIRTTSIQMRWEIFNTGFLSQAAFCRVVLVYDKNPNGTAATLNQIWDPELGLPFTHLTLRNREFRQRFNILYDKMFTIGDPGLSATYTAALPQGGNDRCLKNFKMFKKQNSRIVYKETSPTGSIAETNQGAYYLATWCSIDMQCQGGFNLRLTYTDD